MRDTTSRNALPTRDRIVGPRHQGNHEAVVPRLPSVALQRGDHGITVSLELRCPYALDV